MEYAISGQRPYETMKLGHYGPRILYKTTLLCINFEEDEDQALESELDGNKCECEGEGMNLPRPFTLMSESLY